MWALAFVGLSPGGVAFAHKLAVKRTLLIEPEGGRGLHVLLALHVPGGRPRRGLSLLFDTNHDGRISGLESDALRSTLTRRALDGLVLCSGTGTVAFGGLAVKDRIQEGDGPIDLVIHGVAELPAGPDRHALSLTTALAGDPLDVVVLPGTRPVVEASSGRLERGQLKIALRPGDFVSWREFSR